MPLTHPQNGVQQYLATLTPTIATNYSRWKATRKMKHPQQHTPPLQLHNDTWATTDKQKATAFAEHLATAFRPFPSQSTSLDEENLLHKLNVPHHMTLPLKKIRIHKVIQYKTHPTKAPGYNLITGKILKELSRKGFYAVMQIIMTAKPSKNPADVTSYRPIGLLLLLSKILEKILLR